MTSWFPPTDSLKGSKTQDLASIRSCNARWLSNISLWNHIYVQGIRNGKPILQLSDWNRPHKCQLRILEQSLSLKTSWSKKYITLLIRLKENLNRKPSIFPLKMGLSSKFSRSSNDQIEGLISARFSASEPKTPQMGRCWSDTLWDKPKSVSTYLYSYNI